MTLRFTPLIDAAMEMRLEATTAHLWFEEIISGDRKVEIETVWTHLDRAQWYTSAMLVGGESLEGKFIALSDPVIIQEVLLVQGSLKEFRQIAELRWQNKNGNSGVGSDADQKFDRVFEKFVDQADVVETEIQGLLQESIKQNRIAQLVLQVSAILIAFLLFRRIRIQEQEKDKLVQAADAANRAKSDFLTMMSHELRTPMNGVLGMAQLLSSSDLTEEQASCCDIIMKSGDSLVAILSDILDLAKVEANKQEIILAPMSILEVVRFETRLFGGSAASKGISLNINVDSKVKKVLSGDAHLLKRILSNLLGNAVKFTSNGKINIDVSLQEAHAGEQWVSFSISDTGIGISEEDQKTIFSPFQQVQGGSTRGFGGTGLGLAIVKELVELLGGEIGIKSKVEEGSTFFFSLPFQVIAETEPVNFMEVDVVDTQDSNPRLRYLLVEDDQINQQIVERMLESENVQIHIADRGDEALAMSERTKYDLIFMDILMPVMDGYEVTKNIRHSQANLNRTTPIIALSVLSTKEIQDKCTQAGMNGFLSKPLELKRLKEAVQKVLA